jgi:hypothetical protein
MTVARSLGAAIRRVRGAISTLRSALLPPACNATFCRYFDGVNAPGNCVLERTPSRCKIIERFNMRQHELRKRAKSEAALKEQR